MVASLLTITTTFEAEGTCYGVPESQLRLMVAPKRKNRWACTLYDGQNVLQVSILDPTDKKQRDGFLKDRDLKPDEINQLKQVLMYVGLHAEQDAERWQAWRDEEAERATDERAQQARQALDAR